MKKSFKRIFGYSRLGPGYASLCKGQSNAPDSSEP